MASTFFVTSDGHTLCPNSRAAALELAKLPRRTPLRVSPAQPRNGKQHRLFWAFATLVADALNDGPAGEWDQERVVTHIKLATGHVRLVRLSPADAKRAGTDIAALPASISYGAMDGVDFGDFMARAFRYVRDDLAPWIEDSRYWPDVRQILAESGYVGEEA